MQTATDARTITVPVRLLEPEWLLPLGMRAIAEGDIPTAQLLAAEILHRMWAQQMAAGAVQPPPVNGRRAKATRFSS